MLETLGGRIRRLRLGLNLNQEELGILADVSQPIVSRLEADYYKGNLPKGVIEKLAPVLNVEAEYLFAARNRMAHIPLELLEFICQQDALDFLREAHNNWLEHRQGA